jgi:hypothetical protein
MLQFYFLSIMLNMMTGLIILYGHDLCQDTTTVVTSEKFETKDDTGKEKDVKKNIPDLSLKLFSDNGFVNNRTFRLVLGILTIFVGFMKLLSVVSDGTPIVGDLFPALAGLSGGVTLVVEYYRTQTTPALPIRPFLRHFFVTGRRYIGIVCLVAALLHFLLPQVILL